MPYLTHGLYGLLPLGLCLNSVGTDNITALILPGLSYLINDWVVGVSVCLAFGGLGLFAMRQFDTVHLHRWGHRYLQLVVVLSVLTMLASGSAWYGRFAGPLMTLGMGYWLFLTWAGVTMIRRGDVLLGRLFLLAFTVPLCGAAVGLGRYLGFFPQDQFTQYIVPVTSLIHMIFMALSLTERLRLAERRARAAIERVAIETEHRKDQEKLLAMISHEIRTPISVIDAATQTLEALDARPTPERSERYDRIRRSVGRLGMLVELANARVGPDVIRIRVQRIMVDPVALSERMVALLDEAERARFVVDAERDGPVLEADEKLLRLAWLNLIDNACKYSSPGSPIRIAIRHAEADGKPGIEWAIENEGQPIPVGMEERIFQKFQRGGEYRDKPGLGLGLYLARHIVKLHGGTLGLVRSGRRMTRFVCWIPIAIESEASQS